MEQLKKTEEDPMISHVFLTGDKERVLIFCFKSKYSGIYSIKTPDDDSKQYK